MSSEQDIKSYLESGNLELYASGALSLAESAEVEKMASQHPEIAAELIRISESLAEYAAAYERHPRPLLRKELMERVQKNPSVNKDSRKPSQQPPSSSHLLAYKYLLAAAMASLVISTFASYFFYNRWSETEDKSQVLLAEKNVLSQNYTAVKSVFDKAFSDLSVIRDSHTKMFTLQSADTANDYSARVYWNPLSHEAFIDAQLLPVPDSGKQYQLWSQSAGKYIDAGFFDVGTDNGLIHMKAIFEAETWTVTLEPSGGSPQPSLKSIILVGHKPSS